MGYTTCAYHFFGMRIPREQWTEGTPTGEGARLDTVIDESGVGDNAVSVIWLTAGEYDRHMLFLLIRVEGLDVEVPIGGYRTVPPQSVLPTAEWNTALRIVAANAGYILHELPDATWITVPSVD